MPPDPRRYPAMDVGGSHVSVGLADLMAGRLVSGSRFRATVDPSGSAAEIIGHWATTARRLGPGQASWGVAMPGPFDYRRGIGRFAGVGKFSALAGLDIGAGLAAAIGEGVRIRFSNDADAFAVGEWLAIGEPRPARLVGITLGTGVGTGFVHNGLAVTEGETVPPEGSAYRLTIDGRPLEQTASSRAVLAAYNRACGVDLTSVSALTERARGGDRTALDIFQGAWRAAARALTPYIAAFGAEVVVVGGSIAGSWDLVEPALGDGFASASSGASFELRRSEDPDQSALLGAALVASQAE
ncbi:ROK family protein [Microlunatus endophyticus]|uniref:ROK family protein n=1 Tax=Microlunatus endophyticus TaxID=1716077 RepID=UPI001665BFDC|nr:ROK family protein [Microlunatus endophyticus]